MSGSQSTRPSFTDAVSPHGTAPDGVLGIGVIGLGFMGATHVRAYAAAALAGLPCRVVAVCSQDPEQLSGRATAAGNIATGGPALLFDPAQVLATRDVRELLEHPMVHAVSICTPTDTHAPLALDAIARGRHVLVEKPVALNSQTVRQIADAARAAGVVAMPAMCMRYWPGWDWLRDRIADGSLGRLRSLTLRRLGSRPAWSRDFYEDETRSGGALADLHIHDTDFVRWAVGEPTHVHCTGSAAHMTTSYRFDAPRRADRALAERPHITAEGAWDHDPAFGFRMRYEAVFERGTAEFDIARDPVLTWHSAGSSTPVPLPGCSGYEAEVADFVRAVAAAASGTSHTLRATMDDAVATAELLERERASLVSGG